MGSMSQLWKQYGNDQKRRRAERLPRRIAEIKHICDKLSLVVDVVQPHHVRVTDFNSTLDIFPLHKNYYDPSSKEHCPYENIWDLLLSTFR